MSKTLTIYLAADIKKLTGGLNRAETQMSGFQRGMSNLSNSMSAMLGPALIGAGVAAGALAVSLGVDGVKAAVEDEAAAAKLAKTMENLGLAQDTAAAEASIDAMQRQYGIAETLLRPSYDRLIRSTGDASEATKLLTLAMDISAGTGKSLDSVTQSLTRAASGSATALGKIVPELDKGILKSGDMDAITKELAKTFEGQAQTAAGTYQGQLDRLTIGFGELQEAFGAGFLNALGDSTDQTDGLMDSMKRLEPTMEKLGDKAYETAEGFAQAAVDATSILDAINNGDWQMAWQIFAWGEDSVAGFTQELRLAAAAAYGLNNEWASMGGGEMPGTIGQAAVVTSRYTGYAKALGATIKTTGGNLKDYFTELKTGTGTTSAAATANELLNDSYDAQQKKLTGTTELLKAQNDALMKASQDIADYSQGVADAILGNIDLGQASETGTELGTSTLQAFDDQIAQAKWFGNVLQNIKASGADQKLIDELASLGPAVGGKLGQEMIDNGLIQTFSDKIVEVTAAAKGMGDAMVPEFLLAGEEAAAGALLKIIEKFESEKKTLVKLGKAIGKPIGENIKAEILQSVADALEKAETIKSAAAARRAAERATEQAAATPQQLAQLVAQVINTSNARTGYSMGVPIPSPVLG